MLPFSEIESALQKGLFFITICTCKRQYIFAKDPIDPSRLSKEGEIAKQCWLEISHHFPHVDIDQFVVMPDHVHGILAFKKPAVAVQRFARPLSGSLQTIVGSYKSSVSKIIHEQNDGIGRVWQQGFFDYRIRNIQDLRRVQKYIRENPRKWEEGYRDTEELEEIQVWES